MDSATSLIQVLTLFGYALPELLGCGIALAMLLSGARPGPGRKQGVTGLALMLGSVVIGLLLSLWQNWSVQARFAAGDGTVEIAHFYAAMGVVRILFHLVYMAGLLLLAWGFCRASKHAER